MRDLILCNTKPADDTVDDYLYNTKPADDAVDDYLYNTTPKKIKLILREETSRKFIPTSSAATTAKLHSATSAHSLPPPLQQGHTPPPQYILFRLRHSKVTSRHLSTRLQALRGIRMSHQHIRTEKWPGS